VSCPTALFCSAVGSFWKGSGTAWETLGERWNGIQWSISSTPNPAGATESRLKSVSCTSSSACTAVGYYATASGTVLTLAERWNGAEWVLQATPNQSGTKKDYLYDVSCTSSSDCWAVGSAGEAGPSLVEHWNGTEWTIQTLSEPSSGRLTGISCASTSSCVAVGDGTVERLSGASWTQEQVAGVAISCSSSNNCTAVGGTGTLGEELGPVGEHFPTASHWNGVAWSAQKPSEQGFGALEAVSCVASSPCTAAGRSGTKVYRMLVEERLTGLAPAAVTEAATGLQERKATLNAAVNPRSEETSYQFEYGTTTAYSTRIPASPKSIGAGTADVAVSQTLEGLKSSTTYHVRIVATNGEGTTYGKDRYFTTLPTTGSTEFVAQTYPVDLVGTASGSATWTLSTGQEFSCESQSFTASIEKSGLNHSLPTSMSDYACSANFQVTMSECGFIYHEVEPMFQKNRFHDTFDIGNAPGKTCSPEGAKDPGVKLMDTSLWGSCHFTVPPQSNLSGVTIEKLEGTPETFKVTVDRAFPLTSSGGLCTANSAVYHGSWIVKAYQHGQPHESKYQIGVSPSEEVWSPRFVSGSSGVYPASFNGAGRKGANAFSLTVSTGQSISCSGAALSESLVGPAFEVASPSTYTGCEAKMPEVKPAEVTMNWCSYIFQLQSYTSGHGGMGCAVGKDLEVAIYASEAFRVQHQSLCVYHVAPYSGVGGVGYTTVGSNTIDINLALEGLPVSRTGSILCGSPTTAKYAGELELSGISIE